MLHEFLQVGWHNGGRNLILLRHGSRRKGRQHLQDPVISSYFLFALSLSSFRPSFLFAGTGKEVRRE
jgi:hypothetical protein